MAQELLRVLQAREADRVTTSAAWVSGGRRWGKRHAFVLTASVAALGSAVFDVVHLRDRVEVQLARKQDGAAYYWSTLVTSGLDTDSATQIVFRQSREQLAGQRTRFDYSPFVAAPTIEDVWRAKGLNPFRDARWTAPRSDIELHGLRASQTDARYLFGRIRTRVEDDARRRMQRRVAIALLVALCGGVWLARQRRPRVMLGAVALN